MRYVSTRGEAPSVSFDELLLAGLAPDGGLYVPDEWPSLGEKGIRDLAGLPYADVVRRVTAPYVGDAIPPEDLERMISEAYTRFDDAAVAPLRQLSADRWLLELFHGPTLAFKDYALQLLGRLFGHSRALRGEHITIVGGDLRRHRIGGDRRLPGTGARGRLRVAPQGPRQRGAASSDDDGDRTEHPQHRSGGNVRRLPGRGEGHVQRPGVSRVFRVDGGELDQLGPGHGADRLLLPCSRRAGGARPVASRSSCPPGISATSTRATPRIGWACRSRAWSSQPTETTSSPASSKVRSTGRTTYIRR